MPDGNATNTETKTGTSYLSSLLDRIHAIDLSAIVNLPPQSGASSDDPKNKPLGENYKPGGQLTEMAKRLYVIRQDTVLAGKTQHEKVAEFMAHLLPDQVLGRFREDDPRIVELLALQAEERRLMGEFRLINRLFLAEVLTALPVIPNDADFTVRDDFQVYWKPADPRILEVISGVIHPDLGEDEDGLGGLLGAIFGRRPKPRATH